MDEPKNSVESPSFETTTLESTEARWERVSELVDGALAYPDACERRAFLRRACGENHELRREVEDLLRFESAHHRLVEKPWIAHRPEMVEASGEATLEVGEEIGPYRVEALLGSGGMGVVARVYDPDLERQVALKLLRREQVSSEMLRRFQDERRILARLDHPGIASIFDGGQRASDGLPYFTMEWIDGEPIDTFCDRRELGVRERLELVLQVCDALAEAHRSLVVHRDLKPSNILVTERGEPKLLDFGIAKDLAPSAADAALRTQAQPMTPAYASPEQVRGHTITTATDVYSLGVVLYRLLCGHHPYVLERDVFERARQICETEPRRLSEQAVRSREDWRGGEPVTVAPSVLASQRGTVPKRLRRALSGDLDAIVLKALAKSTEDRYRSIEAFADDLRRYLDGRPVLARHGSWIYRTRKFVTRYRGRLAAASIGMALLVGAGWARYENLQQIAELERAQRETATQIQAAESEADALGSFVRRLLRATDPDERQGQPLTATEILERGQTRAREDLKDKPEILAHQLEAMGLAHQMLGNKSAAKELLEESLRLRRSVYGPDHPLIARGLTNLATPVFELGDPARSFQLSRLSLLMKQRLGMVNGDLTKPQMNLATILMHRGQYAQAEALYQQVLDIRREDYGNTDPEVASTLRGLGTLHFLKSEFTAAEPLLREALEIRRNAYGDEDTRVASAWSSLGRVLQASGKLEEAEEAFQTTLAIRRDRLGIQHVHTALTQKDLASLYFEIGETEKAEAMWAEAMAVLEAQLPEDSWEIADARSQLGERMARAGRIEEARPLLMESYRTLVTERGEESIYARQAWERWERLGNG